jgi:hypothetical protein
MPEIEDPVKIANGYTALQGRSPFNLHTFAGANSFMVDLIKRNKTALGVNANDANFDSTLAAITRNLRYNTLNAELSFPEIANDSLSFELMLTNKSGHKFPSGYPSRRAFVEFKVTTETGENIFTSGSFGSDGEIINYGGVVEPHHDVIRSENQVQIYEMNMGDVNGNFTTVLERGNMYLKDNRLPPLGFTNQHASYDTMRVVGDAENDLDFNRNGATQGTGKDIVHYKIGLNGYSGPLNVTAKVYYQTVPPEWLSEMRLLDAPEISNFLTMFDASENTPVLVAGDSLLNISNPLSTDALRVKSPVFYPNPVMVNSGLNMQFTNKPDSMKLFSIAGQEMPVSWRRTGTNLWHINLPSVSGVYILQVESQGKLYNHRILLDNQ